jgi:hypothetical protein
MISILFHYTNAFTYTAFVAGVHALPHSLNLPTERPVPDALCFRRSIGSYAL